MHLTLYSYLISFPFKQLGWGLRKLSLSGAAGNILAIIIYVLICLIPCLLYFRLKNSGKLLKTDLFLPALSVLLFTVIYYMINPRLFHSGVPESGNILLGSTFYSVFFGYIILRVLEKCRMADTKRLHMWLKTLLTAVIFLLFYAILAECLRNLSAVIQNLTAANEFPDTGFAAADNFPDTNLSATSVFLVLQCLVNILPNALAIFILITVVRSLNELLKDRYSDASVAAVEKLSSRCTKALIISVLSGMIFNILQLLFHQMLSQINIVVSIPVFSIAFVLTVLLMTGYVRENQRLKQDNDLFI